MKKIIALIFLAAMMMSQAVFANADILQIGDGKTVRVSGNAGEKNANISIEVYKGSVSDNINHLTLESMENADYTSLLVCHDQTKTNDDGEYFFEFNINLSSGKYTAYLATEEKDFDAQEFIYISNTDFEKAALLLKNAKASKDVYDVLVKYQYELGLGEEEYNINEFSEILFNTSKEYTIDENSREATWLIVKKALFVQNLNSGKILDIYTVEDEVSLLSQSEIKDYYKKEYVTASLKQDFTKRLAAAKSQSYNDYLDEITPCFILATVKEPNGNKNVENIIKAFDTKIGVDTSKANGDTWSSLAGKDYSTLEALKKDFVNYLPGTQGGTTSGSKGSSSKGGSGLGSTSVSAPSVQNPTVDENIFSDIEGVEWAQEAIVYLAQKGIISGYSDNTFKPNNNIKREEFVKLICEAFVKDGIAADISFSDVASDAWYVPYIKTAYGEEIVKGLGDGSFGVGLNITRQDMAVMIYRAAKKTGIVFDTENKALFEDDDLIADYAKEAVYALKNFGAISGVTEKEFSPLGNATRAQAAKIIYVLCK